MSTFRRKPRKYLNNKDMLKEIHKSKLSYCYSIDEKYNDFDIILDSVDEINQDTIQKAKKSRASRIANKKYEASLDEWSKRPTHNNDKPKQADFIIDPDTIPLEDLVFRVMTYEHIPTAPGRKKNPKTDADLHTRINFPPFKHYAFVDGELKEVLRSHWKGGLSNGSFCQTHGSITPTLAHMMIKLVERYAMRGNWRGYCVDETTEALTQRGWLKYNEITTNDKILSCDSGQLKWSDVEYIYQGHYEGNMFKITSDDGIDMLITPGHKLLTKEGLTRVEYLEESNQIILMGEAEQSTSKPKYNDAFVKLAGWIFTKSQFEEKNNEIHVSIDSDIFAHKVKQCLQSLDLEYSEESNKIIKIHDKAARKIYQRLGSKNLEMDFILALSPSQRKLLLKTVIDSDSIKEKTRKKIDILQALCVLAGYRSNLNLETDDKSNQTYTLNVLSQEKNQTPVKDLDFHGGKNNEYNRHNENAKILHPNFPTVPYKGTVWCPKTQYGCFVARKNGSVYITGNTYNDEMQSAALLQLSEVGLKFNEARSDNPFSYYTATITNSFTRILNLEKRNQAIRDDIMQNSGYMPSYSRQLDDKAAQERAREEDKEKEYQELKAAGYNIIPENTPKK